MYCLKCREPISLLGLRDRKTGYIQYICSKCNVIYLQNSNGLIFPKDEMKELPSNNTEEETIQTQIENDIYYYGKD